jgi:hypothetical protein
LDFSSYCCIGKDDCDLFTGSQVNESCNRKIFLLRSAEFLHGSIHPPVKTIPADEIFCSTFAAD